MHPFNTKFTALRDEYKCNVLRDASLQCKSQCIEICIPSIKKQKSNVLHSCIGKMHPYNRLMYYYTVCNEFGSRCVKNEKPAEHIV